MAMTKHVLDVGNCVPDHAAIRDLIEGSFDAQVVQAHGPGDALDILRSRPIDLVLVNRKLDRDYRDGIDVIKAIKAEPSLATTPVMMLTNLAEHQQLAVAAGAEPGFGKAQLDETETFDRLRAFLG
jgi:two-component system chemotaxis response regulator CheY